MEEYIPYFLDLVNQEIELDQYEKNDIKYSMVTDGLTHREINILFRFLRNRNQARLYEDLADIGIDLDELK